VLLLAAVLHRRHPRSVAHLQHGRERKIDEGEEEKKTYSLDGGALHGMELTRRFAARRISTRRGVRGKVYIPGIRAHCKLVVVGGRWLTKVGGMVGVRGQEAMEGNRIPRCSLYEFW
jgi:hypothetical protein